MPFGSLVASQDAWNVGWIPLASNSGGSFIVYVEDSGFVLSTSYGLINKGKSFFACPFGRFSSFVDKYTKSPCFIISSGDRCLLACIVCLTRLIIIALLAACTFSNAFLANSCTLCILKKEY